MERKHVVEVVGMSGNAGVGILSSNGDVTRSEQVVTHNLPDYSERVRKELNVALEDFEIVNERNVRPACGETECQALFGGERGPRGGGE